MACWSHSKPIELVHVATSIWHGDYLMLIDPLKFFGYLILNGIVEQQSNGVDSKCIVHYRKWSETGFKMICVLCCLFACGTWCSVLVTIQIYGEQGVHGARWMLISVCIVCLFSVSYGREAASTWRTYKDVGVQVNLPNITYMYISTLDCNALL